MWLTKRQHHKTSLDDFGRLQNDLLDFSTHKVSIAEKGSFWHSLLTPGKQMCPKRQALNPDTSQLRSQTFNCDRRFIERSLVRSFLWSAFCHRGGADSRKHTHASLHFWRHHIVRLAHWSVKSWGLGPLWCRCHVVSSRLFGVTQRSRGTSLPCWANNLHILEQQGWN